MNATILTIGDELLIGQVVNTNASWLGEQLTHLGIRVIHHLSVGDQRDAILEALRFSIQSSDVVLISGGLGPTVDDLTSPVVAEYFQKKLVRNEMWLLKVKNYFESRGRPMPVGNEKMAVLPESAVLLENDCGTACGFLMDSKVFVMPGVPHEMKSMFKREVGPRLLLREGRESIVTHTLQTTGIGESALAAKFTQLNQYLGADSEIAFLPSLRGVRIRLTVRGRDSAIVEKKAKEFRQYLVDECQQYYFGDGEITVEELLTQSLAQAGQTVSVAESCTGGLVLSRLTDISGSSASVMGGIVAYDNAVKIRELQVKAELIEVKGAVSEEVASAMAMGVQKKFQTTYGLATTGVAGPTGGTDQKPIGLVYVAVTNGTQVKIEKHLFENDRLRNKERSSQAALNLLKNFMSESQVSK